MLLAALPAAVLSRLAVTTLLHPDTAVEHIAGYGLTLLLWLVLVWLLGCYWFATVDAAT